MSPKRATMSSIFIMTNGRCNGRRQDAGLTQPMMTAAVDPAAITVQTPAVVTRWCGPVVMGGGSGSERSGPLILTIFWFPDHLKSSQSGSGPGSVVLDPAGDPQGSWYLMGPWQLSIPLQGTTKSLGSLWELVRQRGDRDVWGRLAG